MGATVAVSLLVTAMSSALPFLVTTTPFKLPLPVMVTYKGTVPTDTPFQLIFC